MRPDAVNEISKGERFAFGENWARFLNSLNEDRIAKAEASLKTMLGYDRLDGQSFLDVGSGSGFSASLPDDLVPMWFHLTSTRSQWPARKN